MINRQKILVIGDLMLDRYWKGSVNRISPEAPVPIIDINLCEDKPGGAANVAKNLSDFGMEVTLVGIIGKDEAADDLKRNISSLDIKFLPIIDPNIRTTLKLRVIDRDKQLIRIDHEDINASSKIEDLNKSIKLTKKELESVKAKRLGTNQLARSKRQLIGQIAMSAEQHENQMLSMAKSLLAYNKVDELKEICRKIDCLTADEILEVANDVFQQDKLSTLIYK